MARLALRIVYSLLALVVLSGGILTWGAAEFSRPGPLKAATTVVIARGAGLEVIASELTRAGVLADPLVFRLGARLTGADKRLRAGEYAFPARVSPRQTVALLESGKTVVRRLTVVEGLTTAEIVAQLEATDGLAGALGQLPKEGTLLPETYHFSFGDARRAIVGRMAEAMRRALGEAWAARNRESPLETPESALILASIIEKETAVPQERARVAGVFINRLRKGMKLQSDPTVVYGLTGGQGPLGRPLTRADLRTPSPYNTYLIDGLPPSPISNPGLASIVAALDPARTDELYFVADGSGGHVFARTLSEHNRNVARWRKRRHEKK
ncbi:MAG: endolytic transglycosylase MltG [Rhodospirillales bacterium]|jgi:UPF0755 protein|nr:endolytic transglycosylase MltG [Rhodospirillales bacterium]